MAKVTMRPPVNENSDQYRAAHLAAMLASYGESRANPHRCAVDAMLFIRWGKRAAALALKQCNEPTWGERDEKARDRLGERANELAKEYGLRVEITGDPRGYCLKLHGEGVRGNTWGGDESGYGV